MPSGPYDDVGADTPLFGEQPLFGNGEARPRERLINITIILMTCLLVIVTTISAFIPWPSALDIFLVVCIILYCISHLILITWYRQGGVDPKFKSLIYFNTLNISLLCICANIFFHYCV